MSYDPDVYYNPDSEAIRVADYVDTTNPLAVADMRQEIRQEEKQAEKPSEHREPTDDEVDAIKRILNLKRQTAAKTERQIVVPQQLETAMSSITAALAEANIDIVEIVNINYGKKIKMQSGNRLAEVNVFYGKRGFSVVRSPKCGTDFELNALTAELITLELMS